MADYTSTTMADLADAVRAHHRALFSASVLNGDAQPLVLPYSILGPFIVPTLWLAIPHSRNPWLWHARWLVLAYIAWFSAQLIFRTSSLNHAVGYASGLMAYWGLISTMNLCVWNTPQLEAARIVKRAIERSEDGPPQELPEGPRREEDDKNGHVSGPKQNGNGLRHRKHTADMRSKFQAHDPERRQYEYVWEPFPEDGTFARRFNWALDLTTNFRFAGWNTSISAIPRPKLPPETPIPDGTPADISALPDMTYAGYRRWHTQRSFVTNRLLTAGTMYIILDFLAVFMTKDPYFVLGPDHPSLPLLPLPSYLQGLHPGFIRAYRQIFSLAGVLSAISGVFNLNDLAQYFFLSYIFPHRGDLWQHASTFGSFRQVLDRGLAGWWGGWWHQTFRAQFVAPAKWLARQGHVKRGSVSAAVAALVVSFGQSGLLHASGSISSVPDTKIWRSPVFFALQILGIAVQTGTARYLRERMRVQIPQRLARVGNMAFTLTWLYFTGNFFADDMASAGIWLLEPVPFSVFRMAGFGFPGDRWWRWDEFHRPRWHTAQHWWQSGIAV